MALMDDLPHRCTIRRRKRNPDNLGNHHLEFVTEATDVPCWDQQLSSKDVEEFDKRNISGWHKVYFATDRNLTEQHDIQITSRDRGTTTISSPITLEVRHQRLPDAYAGLGGLFKVLCEDVSGTRQ